MSGHTPAPWMVDSTHSTLAIRASKARAGDRYRVASLGIGRRTPDSQDLANARLIAAAPELLEALRRVLVWSSQCPPSMHPDSATFQWERDLGLAKAAIYKAEGR